MDEAKWAVILLGLKILSPALSFLVGWLLPSPVGKKSIGDQS